jgi:hypothetical protein
MKGIHAMNWGKLVAAVCFLLAVSLSAAYAQHKRGPSTPEERKLAVRTARLLEKEPFHEKAQDMRSWFTNWLIQVPDISVTICADYLGPLLHEADNRYQSEIVSQMMFSNAAFMIEHPAQATDKISLGVASLDGSLKTYEAILKTHPEAKSAFLDDLLFKRKKGELVEYVRQISPKCQ